MYYFLIQLEFREASQKIYSVCIRNIGGPSVLVVLASKVFLTVNALRQIVSKDSLENPLVSSATQSLMMLWTLVTSDW